MIHAMRPLAPLLLLALAARIGASPAAYEAAFERGLLKSGGPVVYRGVRPKDEAPAGPDGDRELPSVGFYATAPAGQRLARLVVRAEAAQGVGTLELLLDRDETDSVLDFPAEGTTTVTLELGARGLAGLHRLDLRPRRGSASLTIHSLRLEVEPWPEGDEAPPERLPLEVEGSRVTSRLFPLMKSSTWRFVDGVGASVTLESQGPESFRGAELVRVAREGSDAFFMMARHPGLGIAVHQASEATPTLMLEAPAPLALGPEVLAGDLMESLGKKLRWRTRVEVAAAEDGVPARTLRLHLDGYPAAGGKALASLDLWLLEDEGPRRWSGRFLGEALDWRLPDDEAAPAPEEPPEVPEPEQPPVLPDPDPVPEPMPDPDPIPDPQDGTGDVGRPGSVVVVGPGHRVNPVDPDAMELARYDRWLAAHGLDRYGRKLGPVRGGRIGANGNPDMGGLTRLQWLRQVVGPIDY